MDGNWLGGWCSGGLDGTPAVLAVALGERHGRGLRLVVLYRHAGRADARDAHKLRGGSVIAAIGEVGPPESVVAHGASLGAWDTLAEAMAATRAYMEGP